MEPKRTTESEERPPDADGTDARDAAGVGRRAALKTAGAAPLLVPFADLRREAGAPDRADAGTGPDRDQDDEAAGTIAWTLDDGLESHYGRREVFLENDVVPGIAVQSGTVGQSGRLTWDQVHALVETHGWELLNHGIRGRSPYNFNNLSPEEIRTQVYGSTSAFLQRRLAPKYYVYNQGGTGGACGKKIVSEVFPFGLGVEAGPITGDPGGDFQVDPYDLRRTPTDEVPVQEILDVVERAAAAETGLIVNSHIIVEGDVGDEGRLQTSTGKIEEVVEFARSQGMEWGTTTDVLADTFDLPFRGRDRFDDPCEEG